MGKRTLKYKGGKAFASGSSGCVFDKKFDKDGNPSDTNDTVSKVFPVSKYQVSEDEFKIQSLVRTITGGKGVITSNLSQLKVISTVNDEIPDTLGTACQLLKNDKRQNKTPFSVIEYPRINGDLFRLPIQDKPAAYFAAVDFALAKLSNRGIIHADVATRNIYDVTKPDGTTEAALGDFGDALYKKDPRFLDKFKILLPKIGNRILDFIGGDDRITPYLGIAALFYLNKDDSTKIKGLKTEIEGILADKYTEKGVQHYSFEDFWSSVLLRNRKDLIPQVVEALVRYMNRYLKVLQPEHYEPMFEAELAMSDQTMFEVVKVKKGTNDMTLGHFIDSKSRVSQGQLVSRLAALGGKRKTRKNQRRRNTKWIVDSF